MKRWAGKIRGPTQAYEFDGIRLRSGDGRHGLTGKARFADVLDVAVIGSTTTTEDLQAGKLVEESAILPTQLYRITLVKVCTFVQFSVTASRGIRTKPADAPQPGFALG
jgi:hypothetical protein